MTEQNEKNPPVVPSEERDQVNVWAPEITKQIDALIALVRPQVLAEGEEDTSDLAREIVITALKTQQANLSRIDVKILSRAIRELRFGFRVFRPYRDRRKVTIFGSARTRPMDIDYKQARAFGRKMVQNGYMVITGAGPGIMQAGNQGAGPENSFGINIKLPFEQSANEFVAKDDRFIDCRFFFTRKLMFLKETNAVVLFPGGFGTHDEGMEVLTLVQTGKADPMPIVFVETPGGCYWSDWEKYVRKNLLGKKKISPEDFSLFRVTDSVNTAVEEILTFYKNYHSLRYVKDQLVMRLQRAPDEPQVGKLNREFRDIMVAKSTIQVVDPFPEEKEHLHLPRITFAFNRTNYGRLRQFINAVNLF